MSNKYANLVGINKIKDEYTKINTGFDGIETDINTLDTRVDTIITTPIEGAAAAQEIVDARVSAVKEKTFATLDARFEESEQDIATHLADNVTDADGAHGLKIEEGLFTPTIQGTTVAGSNSYTTQFGKFTKIGKRVFINICLAVSTINVVPMEGVIIVAGFPFIISPGQFITFSIAFSNIDFRVGATTLVAISYNGGTSINIRDVGDNIEAYNIPVAAFKNGSNIYISGSYLTN